MENSLHGVEVSSVHFAKLHPILVLVVFAYVELNFGVVDVC